MGIVILAKIEWSELADILTILPLLSMCVLQIGAIPFFMGIALQCLIKGKNMPEYEVWIVASILVALYSLPNLKQIILIQDHSTIDFIFSIAITGIFIDIGAKCCQEFRKGQKEINSQQSSSPYD